MKRISIAIALMMVALLMGCNLELVDSSIFEEVEEENQAGLESGFAGGNGTEASPFLIANREQFLNISEYCSGHMEEITYFELADDIDIKGSDYVDQFSGVLTGGASRHSVNVIDENSSFPYVFRATGKHAEFRGFDFHTQGGKILVYGDELTNEQGAITLQTEFVGFYDVDVYGEAEVGTNTGFYLVYAEADKVVFEDCTNNASMYGGANSYSAPFLGYIVANATSGMTVDELVFRNCTNNGNMLMANAGFLVANGGNGGNWRSRYVLGEDGVVPEGSMRLIVENIKNTGTINGYAGNAGWFTWNKSNNGESWDEVNQYVESAITNTGTLSTEGVAGLKLTADDSSGHVVLAATVNGEPLDASGYDVVYEKSFYGRYTHPVTGEFVGTLRSVYEVDPQNAGQKAVTIEELKVFEIDNVEMQPEEPEGNWTFTITLYDKTTGYPVGSAKV